MAFSPKQSICRTAVCDSVTVNSRYEQNQALARLVANMVRPHVHTDSAELKTRQQQALVRESSSLLSWSGGGWAGRVVHVRKYPFNQHILPLQTCLNLSEYLAAGSQLAHSQAQVGHSWKHGQLHVALGR